MIMNLGCTIDVSGTQMITERELLINGEPCWCCDSSSDVGNSMISMRPWYVSHDEDDRHLPSLVVPVSYLNPEVLNAAHSEMDEC